MKSHIWVLIPFNEMVELNLYRLNAPYLWRYDGCGAIIRTKNAKTPDNDHISSVARNVFDGIDDDCDHNLVKKIMNE